MALQAQILPYPHLYFQDILYITKLFLFPEAVQMLSSFSLQPAGNLAVVVRTLKASPPRHCLLTCPPPSLPHHTSCTWAAPLVPNLHIQLRFHICSYLVHTKMNSLSRVPLWILFVTISTLKSDSSSLSRHAMVVYVAPVVVPGCCQSTGRYQNY